MKGMVFNVQHFSVHDGTGIRTVVFLKGCDMHCQWCANPESQSFVAQLSFKPQNCIGSQCKLCLDVCESSAISFDSDGMVQLDWSQCIQCQACVSACVPGALETFGKENTVQEILEEVEEDLIFYGRSKGGLTLSGGEVCLQPDFACALLQGAKDRGINTDIETCGLAPWSSLERISQLCDHIFFDIKHMDSDKHRLFTGSPNTRILDNFLKLVQSYPQELITVRTPVIPGFNDTISDIQAIEGFLKKAAPNVKYELLKYHRFGESKYACIGREYPMGSVELSDEKFNLIRDSLTISGVIR